MLTFHCSTTWNTHLLLCNNAMQDSQKQFLMPHFRQRQLAPSILQLVHIWPTGMDSDSIAALSISSLMFSQFFAEFCCHLLYTVLFWVFSSSTLLALSLSFDSSPSSNTNEAEILALSSTGISSFTLTDALTISCSSWMVNATFLRTGEGDASVKETTLKVGRFPLTFHRILQV